jgi:hypothetical protein
MLIGMRNQARADKNFAFDQIRDQLILNSIKGQVRGNYFHRLRVN